MTEPTLPPFNLNKMPAMLKELPQWVCWKREFVRGRWTKMPYNPKTGGRAVTTEANTWDTLENTLAAYKRGGYLGIGFVFANNNIIGIDLDHCIKDGVLHPDAERIVTTCNSYTEYSVSGDGLHVLLLGTKNTAACVKPDMSWGGECAVWERDRFFAMTGRPFGEYPAIPQSRQAELNAVCAMVWPNQTGPDPKVMQQVRDLKVQGLTVREIAEKVKLSVGCVAKYLKPADAAPADNAAEIEATYAIAPAQDAEAREQNEGPSEQIIPDRVNTPEILPESEVGPREQDGGAREQNGKPREQTDVHAVGDVVHAVAEPVQVRPAQIQPRPVIVMTDEEILIALPQTFYGKEFEALWTGNWNGEEGRKNGKSEADYHLCRHLAYCTKDPAQIDRLFRRSALMRPKWDVGQPGNTYGEHTIKKVLGRVTAQYRGSLHKRRSVAEDVVDAKAPEANVLLTRAKALIGELKAQPDITRLPGAITDFLWRLPDMYLDDIKRDLADCLNGSFKVSNFNKAIQAERAERKSRAAAATPKVQVDTKIVLRNHTVTDGVDSEGNQTQVVRAVPIYEVRQALLKTTADWPRRVGELVFVDENCKIRYLRERDSLFAWLQERMLVSWDVGRDTDRISLSSKPEFFAHLKATLTEYETIEVLPHEPIRPKSYYAWKPVEDYQPDGRYLDFLLDHFDNFITPEDLILYKAALMTPAWGGSAGKRPAIWSLADGQGYGKSTTSNVIGNLYRGFIDFPVNEKNDDKLTSRLLTPDVLTTRVVRVDNADGYYGSRYMEGLITSPVISGHRLFYGEASRPNTMTFVFNGNNVRLSRDMAERSVLIRLKRPDYRPTWESEVYKFVEDHRDLILMDIVAELKKEPARVTVPDRYAEWVSCVLARCGGDTDAIVRLIQARRAAHDEDREEATELMDAIDEAARNKHQARVFNISQQGESIHDVEPEEWCFIPASDMTNIVNVKLNTSLTARAVNSKLTGHIAGGRMPRVEVKRTNTERGYMVRNKTIEGDSESSVKSGLEDLDATIPGLLDSSSAIT